MHTHQSLLIKKNLLFFSKDDHWEKEFGSMTLVTDEWKFKLFQWWTLIEINNFIFLLQKKGW